MANLYLPDPELKRLKRLARAAGYKIKRGPGSQIGVFVARLLDEYEQRSHIADHIAALANEARMK